MADLLIVTTETVPRHRIVRILGYVEGDSGQPMADLPPRCRRVGSQRGHRSALVGSPRLRHGGDDRARGRLSVALPYLERMEREIDRQ
jgi:hypothetical protein